MYFPPLKVNLSSCFQKHSNIVSVSCLILSTTFLKYYMLLAKYAPLTEWEVSFWGFGTFVMLQFKAQKAT